MPIVKTTLPDDALEHIDYLVDVLRLESTRAAVIRKAVLAYLKDQEPPPPTDEPTLPFEP